MIKGVFYKEKDLLIRSGSPKDIEFLAENMRMADIEEIWSSHHHSPRKALEISIKESEEYYTFSVGGRPHIMAGVNPQTILSTKAVVWMLSSDHIDTMKIKVLRLSKMFVAFLLGRYPHLYNYVSVKNDVSIKWLKYLGAEFSAPEVYGVERELFQHFHLQAKNEGGV